MDKMLGDALPPRIYFSYFTANSHWAICHNPIQMVQNGVPSPVVS
jgi:hypothetical protein